MIVVNYISKGLMDSNKSFLEFVNDGERLLLLAIEEMNKKPSFWDLLNVGERVTILCD